LTKAPPPLYRVSRLLRRLSYLAAVLLVVYLATAAYSATQIRPGHQQSGGSHTSWATGGSVALTTSINLTNHGFYALNDFHLDTRVSIANGTSVAQGSSPSVTIAPGGTTTVPLTVTIPLNGSAAATALLTHDETLPATIFANASYVGLFAIHLVLTNNVSWGAPFYALNATAGTPTSGTNGTVSVPVTVSFQDHSSVADIGTLRFSVHSGAGASCGSGSLDLNVPAGGSFQQTTTVYLVSGCNPRGGTLVSSYTTMGTTLPLPAENLP
jgi:hypothetical protein